MFKEMRRKEKQMTQQEVDLLMQKSLYGTLSSMGEDGYPYGVPVSFIYQFPYIYFHSSIVEGHKAENFKFSKKVCFTVVEQVETIPSEFNTRFRSVIAFGLAEAADPETTTDVYRRLVDKYSPDYKKEGEAYRKKAGHAACVYRIKIEHMTGKEKR